jgi:solute carrier family 4 anion exchanger 2
MSVGPWPGLTLPHGFLLQFFLQEDEGTDRKAERTSPSPPVQLPPQEVAPRATKGAQTG